MALQDFYGTYEVQNTSGTEFGLNTTVVISDQEPDGTIPVSFTPSVEGPIATTETATYEESTDSLRIALQDDESEVMFISRFVDPTPGSTYRSIYSITITPPIEGQARRLRVWSAELIEPGSGTVSPVVTPLPQEAFAGNHLVGTTVDAQFGAGSAVTITEQTNGFLSLKIVNALGVSVTLTTLSYDAETVAVRGTTNGTVNGPDGPELVPAVVAMSLALMGEEREAEKKFIYGAFIVGDPQQGGTFGGEEESGGATTSDDRFSKLG